MISQKYLILLDYIADKISSLVRFDRMLSGYYGALFNERCHMPLLKATGCGHNLTSE
jgi:hypothetical protein